MTILTAEEAANFLRLPYNTFCHLASQGILPAVKLGRQWRTTREQLELYINNHVKLSVNIDPRRVNAR